MEYISRKKKKKTMAIALGDNWDIYILKKKVPFSYATQM